MTADFVLAGTGPRALLLEPREVREAAMNLCLERIAERVLEHGSALVVMSGGAEGADECLARAAMRMQVRLWLAIPNKGYVAHYWGRKSQLGRDRTAEFARIAAYAEKTTHVMEQVHGTSKLTVDGLHANAWRNLWMVNGGRGFDGADDFAVFGPVWPRSGTAHCVEAIRAAGKWRDHMMLDLPLSDPNALPIGSVSGTPAGGSHGPLKVTPTHRPGATAR